jgi:hypothetical protein
MNLKNTTHIAAWLVVGSGVCSVVAVLIMAGSGGSVSEFAENQYTLLIAIPLGMLRVAIFVYPVSVLWHGVKEKSYQFLKSPIHYVAAPATLLIWVVSFF